MGKQTGHGALTAREREVVDVAADGRSTRELADALHLSPRTVEHHLSSAYRKLGVASRAELIAHMRPAGEDEAIPTPETRYARSGDAHIAYQVIGEGPPDVVLIPGFVSNVETQWTWPRHGRFLRRLAAGRRLILFDKRGTGLSDPVADSVQLTLEQRMDEVRAVMDAAGSGRATLFGFSEGAALSLLFAAAYPARTNGLVLYGGLISGALDAHANAIVAVFANPAAAWDLVREQWGTGGFLAPFGPSLGDDPDERRHLARFERHGASPAAAYTIIRMACAIDVRWLANAVHTPTLVVHRRDDLLVPVANSRFLAKHLPAARYVELPGYDHPPWIGDTDAVMEAVEEFLAVEHPLAASRSRLLLSFVLADRALPPRLLPTIERFRGRPSSTRHGIVYTFDGPVRAVACALALVAHAPDTAIAVHVGELEASAAGLEGPPVHTAATMLASAGPSQVVVSAIAKDLAAGSEFVFVSLGRGDPPLFTARPPERGTS